MPTDRTADELHAENLKLREKCDTLVAMVKRAAKEMQPKRAGDDLLQDLRTLLEEKHR